MKPNPAPVRAQGARHLPLRSALLLLFFMLTWGSLRLAAAAASSTAPLSNRIQELFEVSRDPQSGVAVIFEDTLGDGPQTWDPRSLSPAPSGAGTRSTNCINWVFETLAQAYSGERGFSSRKTQDLLNRLRYYEGVPAWGARKHFLDQMLPRGGHPWIEFGTDELPRSCRPLVATRNVVIDPEAFARRNRYRCGLPLRSKQGSQRERVAFTFLRWKHVQALEKCVADLPSGAYGLFGVPSQFNLRMYGKKSGVMGRTHPAFLIRPPDKAGAFLLHASIRHQVPVRETLTEWHGASGKWFEGVQIFSLAETWPESGRAGAPRESLRETEKAALANLRACEKSLALRGETRPDLSLR